MPHDEVKRHFEACSQCYPHLQLESAYREAVQRAGAGEHAPSDLKEKVTELLEEARSEEGSVAKPRACPASEIFRG